MKCENCNHNKMLHVDDVRVEGGSGFDSYMCPVCLTECYIEYLSNKMATKKWSFRQQYLIRDEDLVRKTYRNGQTGKN
ncbi:gp100 (endogenous virus) [Lactococcus phage KSY1]|uniref:Gp100 n=1 Tax=Lactococcus phage KSY1 TaxID=2913972 RepID=A6MAG5_9CAUD|nr:gp100 [Lactococcus phage KSY1]ABG21643.1 gp100 [Lactococcus phage KSY1]